MDNNNNTVLQGYAITVAAKTEGVDVGVVLAGLEVGVLDWAMIISMIMEAIMAFIQQCQQTEKALVTSVKNPNRLQKARFYNLVRDSFDDCRYAGWRRQARLYADTMMGNLPTDAEIVQIVQEVRGGF